MSCNHMIKQNPFQSWVRGRDRGSGLGLKWPVHKRIFNDKKDTLFGITMELQKATLNTG